MTTIPSLARRSDMDRTPKAPDWLDRVRRDFPILHTRSHGKPLVFLDNGATSQKPRAVIDAISRYYESQNANIHRGVYELSQIATGLYEAAREKVRSFINAKEAAECLFTRGTTESINLVAATWGRKHVHKDDVVIVSHLEHHSNIVPWQMLCETVGGILKVIPVNDAGELDMAHYKKILAEGRVKIVSVNHVSNSLGTINPVEEIIQLAHAAGAVVLLDGAQWVAHGTTDVQALNADFYAFSGHKMMGPTGIGILYGKRALLDAMPPYQGGGDMIASVTFPKTEYAAIPNKFEAGTPDIAGAIGLGAAVDYLTSLDLSATAAYEHELLLYATEKLRTIPGLKIIGTAKEKASVLSFVVDGLSTMDIGVGLDREGIAVRTGHHCCQPVMERFGIAATARASLAFYNTREEIDALAAALQKLVAQKSEAKSRNQESDGGAIAYPAATADSVEAAADALAAEFEFLPERDSKNEYVMELAEKLPHTFDLLKQVTPRVPGCMSQVHLLARRKQGGNGTVSEPILEFVADADAEIVRGLIAILQQLYSGQKTRDILAFDIEKFFSRIGLDQFISSQRRNGLAGMVTKIREQAKQIQAAAKQYP